MWCFVLINLVLLLATRAIMRGRSGPGTKLVAIGSNILVVISIVSLVLMVVSIPGLLAA
jgi:hypothetical protein